MHKTNRREFLQRSMAVAAAAALPTTVWAAQVRRASDVIELGPEKVKVSRMAVGTGTMGGGFSSNQLRKLGVEGVADMLVDAYENGVFTWDTSDSYGTHAAMKVATKSSWIEVCMARINPAGVRMDAPTETVLPLLAELKASGKGIIGMKVLGEGRLKDRIDEALLFALNKSPAHCFTIGCESKAEFKDNFDRIAKLSQTA